MTILAFAIGVILIVSIVFIMMELIHLRKIMDIRDKNNTDIFEIHDRRISNVWKMVNGKEED